MPLFRAADSEAVQACARHLAHGALVAFPTETVYGLGARADDDMAVAAIFSAKGRPSDHPLIVHVATLDDAAYFSPQPGAVARRLMQAFWPGPLTVIVPRAAAHGAAAAGGQGSIGLRMPSHPAALALLQAATALGVHGVAGPSANRFGRVSSTRAAHVLQEFGPQLWVLDGGDCPVGIESAIVDCTRPQPALLRPGLLDRRVIEAVLGQPLAAPDADSPRASGTLVSHYAPRAAVRLFDPAELASALGELAADPAQAPGSVGVYSRVAPRFAPVWKWRARPAAPVAVAHELFSVLRDFDAAGVVCIWVEQPPAGPEWDGVRDRLQRAAAL